MIKIIPFELIFGGGGGGSGGKRRVLSRLSISFSLFSALKPTLTMMIIVVKMIRRVGGGR